MTEAPTPAPSRIPDDVAYWLPMALFLACLWVGGHWDAAFVPSYVARVLLTAAALFLLRSHYTRVRWNGWWLGVIVGVVGLFQWVGMQTLLERASPFFQGSGDVFDPTEHYTSATAFWSFVAIRLTGAVLVVPFMEELFWRDWMWRTILAPNDFKLAKVGEFDWAPVLIVSGAFATVHGHWWLTAIVWGLMVAGLLVYTKSLGACIIAHATTNLLLGVYVLRYHAWSYW
jgi:CAAX prenyl protease-like protein